MLGALLVGLACGISDGAPVVPRPADGSIDVPRDADVGVVDVQPFFVAPLPGWIDAVADHGAVGDGEADDTAALQGALDALAATDRAPVVWVPAGTYRITRTLTLTGMRNVGLIGEHPERVTFLWDGPPGGTMLDVRNSSFARIGRLAWSGQGTASRGMFIGWDGHGHGSGPERFEIFDSTFRDLEVGIQGGSLDDSHQNSVSDVTVIRCRFERNSRAGVRLEDWNTIGWTIDRSEFESNRTGVHIDPGIAHVYRSVFRGSAEVDIFASNNDHLIVRENVSFGSGRFLASAGPTGDGFHTLVQGNYVVESANAPVHLLHLGPVILADNYLDHRPGAPVVFGGFHPGELLMIGNRFVVDPYVGGGDGFNRIRRIDDRIVPAGSVAPPPSPPPRAPPLHRDPIVEVSERTGAAIQAAINLASTTLQGRRPVVYLPYGDYAISSTVRIPAESDVVLIGDMGFFGPSSTRLVWSGPREDAVLEVVGPSRAVIRDLSVVADRNDGIVLSEMDGARGLVRLDQVDFNRAAGAISGRALRVDGLDESAVEVLQTRLGGDRGSVLVRGGSRALAEGLAGRVTLVGGASSGLSVEAGGRALAAAVHDVHGREAPRHVELTDSGELAVVVARVVREGAASASAAATHVDGFRGRATFALARYVGASVDVGGDEPLQNVLFAGLGTVLTTAREGCHDAMFRLAESSGHSRRVSSYYGQLGVEACPLPDDLVRAPSPDLGHEDDEWLLRMLAAIRGPWWLEDPGPESIFVELSRVGVDRARNGVTILGRARVRPPD